MKSDGVMRHVILAFVLALAGYGVFYAAIEHRRTRNGPWQVTFTNSVAGAPLLVINQPRLGITNFCLGFSSRAFPATNLPFSTGTLTFAQPQPVPYPVPFGECVFMDTTFLPGTVTFRLFDHEIELLPRTLIIDHRERAWGKGTAIDLPEAPAPPGQAAR
jgi:hypothetical protein